MSMDYMFTAKLDGSRKSVCVSLDDSELPLGSRLLIERLCGWSPWNGDKAIEIHPKAEKCLFEIRHNLSGETEFMRENRIEKRHVDQALRFLRWTRKHCNDYPMAKLEIF